MYLALFLAGLLAGEAVRVDVGQENKVNESGMEKKAGVVLGRLKAFDESGLRKLAQDPTVELFLPSFIEEDATPELPAQWRSQLTIGKVLGEGSFGKVFKCQVKCDPTQYVTVKLIKDKTADVLQEIKVLESMQGVSEFCISSIGNPTYINAPEGYWIMMPLMNSGELWDLVVKCAESALCVSAPRKAWNWVKPMYNEAFMLMLFHDIVSGVQALHQRGLLHTDLKTLNVMMNCVGSNCYAAVIDLGLACNMNVPNACGLAGTPGYIPWEVYPAYALPGSNAYRYPSRDVWALGVILYELLYSKFPPFWGDRDGSKVYAYDANADPNIPSPRTKTDQLVADMLTKDYHKRPSISEILERIENILIVSDFTTYQKTKLTASARHATSAVPTCLLYPTTTTTTMQAWAGPGRWVPSGQHYVEPSGLHQPAVPLRQPNRADHARPAFRPFTGSIGPWVQMRSRYCRDQPTTVPGQRCGNAAYTDCCRCYTIRDGKGLVQEHFRSKACR